MILQVNNPTIKNGKSLYAKLIGFCRRNDLSLAKMRSDSKKNIIVEYRARFAKKMYPEYNYSEISKVLKKNRTAAQYWIKERTPIDQTLA